MNPHGQPCRSQAECLAHAVAHLCAPGAAPADARLALADMLEELAREQALSPLHAPLADHSRAMADRLRAATV